MNKLVFNFGQLGAVTFNNFLNLKVFKFNSGLGKVVQLLMEYFLGQFLLVFLQIECREGRMALDIKVLLILGQIAVGYSHIAMCGPRYGGPIDIKNVVFVIDAPNF